MMVTVTEVIAAHNTINQFNRQYRANHPGRQRINRWDMIDTTIIARVEDEWGSPDQGRIVPHVEVTARRAPNRVISRFRQHAEQCLAEKLCVEDYGDRFRRSFTRLAGDYMAGLVADCDPRYSWLTGSQPVAITKRHGGFVACHGYQKEWEFPLWGTPEQDALYLWESITSGTYQPANYRWEWRMEQLESCRRVHRLEAGLDKGRCTAEQFETEIMPVDGALDELVLAVQGFTTRREDGRVAVVEWGDATWGVALSWKQEEQEEP